MLSRTLCSRKKFQKSSFVFKESQLNLWPFILTAHTRPQLYESCITVSPDLEFDKPPLQEPEDSVFLTINRSALKTSKWQPRCSFSFCSEKKKRHAAFSPCASANGHRFTDCGSPITGSWCLCVTWIIKGSELTYWRHNILLKLVKSLLLSPWILQVLPVTKLLASPSFTLWCQTRSRANHCWSLLTAFEQCIFLMNLFVQNINEGHWFHSNDLSLFQGLHHERIAMAIIFCAIICCWRSFVVT